MVRTENWRGYVVLPVKMPAVNAFSEMGVKSNCSWLNSHAPLIYYYGYRDLGMPIPSNRGISNRQCPFLYVE